MTNKNDDCGCKDNIDLEKSKNTKILSGVVFAFNHYQSNLEKMTYRGDEWEKILDKVFLLKKTAIYNGNSYFNTMSDSYFNTMSDHIFNAKETFNYKKTGRYNGIKVLIQAGNKGKTFYRNRDKTNTTSPPLYSGTEVEIIIQTRYISRKDHYTFMQNYLKGNPWIIKILGIDGVKYNTKGGTKNQRIDLNFFPEMFKGCKKLREVYSRDISSDPKTWSEEDKNKLMKYTDEYGFEQDFPEEGISFPYWISTYRIYPADIINRFQERYNSKNNLPKFDKWGENNERYVEGNLNLRELSPKLIPILKFIGRSHKKGSENALRNEEGVEIPIRAKICKTKSAWTVPTANVGYTLKFAEGNPGVHYSVVDKDGSSWPHRPIYITLPWFIFSTKRFRFWCVSSEPAWACPSAWPNIYDVYKIPAPYREWDSITDWLEDAESGRYYRTDGKMEFKHKWPKMNMVKGDDRHKIHFCCQADNLLDIYDDDIMEKESTLKDYFDALWRFYGMTEKDYAQEATFPNGDRKKGKYLRNKMTREHYMIGRAKTIYYSNEFKLSNSCFEGCESLSKVQLFTNTVTLPESCFKNCSSLVSVEMNQIKNILENCFLNCTNITQWKLGYTYEKISNNAFEKCPNLRKIILNNLNYKNIYRRKQWFLYNYINVLEIESSLVNLTIRYPFLHNSKESLSRIIVNDLVENVETFFNNFIKSNTFDNPKTINEYFPKIKGFYYNEFKNRTLSIYADLSKIPNELLEDLRNEYLDGVKTFGLDVDPKISEGYISVKSNDGKFNIIGPKVNLAGANLEGTDLRNANLTETDLVGANLEGTDLKNANLTETNLKFTNLKRADLTKAILNGTILNNSNLYEANLTGVNLTNIDLTGVKTYNVLFEDSNPPKLPNGYEIITINSKKVIIGKGVHLSNINLSNYNLNNLPTLENVNLSQAIFNNTISLISEEYKNVVEITTGELRNSYFIERSTQRLTTKNNFIDQTFFDNLSLPDPILQKKKEKYNILNRFKIKIYDGITEIRENAFSKFNLASPEYIDIILNSISSINDRQSFFDNYKDNDSFIHEISIPDSVEKINLDVFRKDPKQRKEALVNYLITSKKREKIYQTNQNSFLYYLNLKAEQDSLPNFYGNTKIISPILKDIAGSYNKILVNLGIKYSYYPDNKKELYKQYLIIGKGANILDADLTDIDTIDKLNIEKCDLSLANLNKDTLTNFYYDSKTNVPFYLKIQKNKNNSQGNLIRNNNWKFNNYKPDPLTQYLKSGVIVSEHISNEINIGIINNNIQIVNDITYNTKSKQFKVNYTKTKKKIIANFLNTILDGGGLNIIVTNFDKIDSDSLKMQKILYQPRINGIQFDSFERYIWFVKNYNKITIKGEEYFDLSQVSLESVELKTKNLNGIKTYYIQGTPKNLPKNYKLLENKYQEQMIVGKGVYLRHANFHKVDFTGCDLSNVNMNNALINETNFSNIKYKDKPKIRKPYKFVKDDNEKNFIFGPGVVVKDMIYKNKEINKDKNTQKLSLCIFENCDFTNTVFEGKELESYPEDISQEAKNLLNKVDLTKSEFKNCNLSGVQFINCSFDRLRTSDLTINKNTKLPDDYKFKGLSKARFIVGPKVDLSNMNLSNIDLSDCNLTGVRAIDVTSNKNTKLPQNYKIIGKILFGKYVNLSNSQLSNFDLSKLNLRKANLSSCNLSNVNFTGSILSGVNFRHSIFTNVNMTNVEFDKDTKLPDDYIYKNNKLIYYPSSVIEYDGDKTFKLKNKEENKEIGIFRDFEIPKDYIFIIEKDKYFRNYANIINNGTFIIDGTFENNENKSVINYGNIYANGTTNSYIFNEGIIKNEGNGKFYKSFVVKIDGKIKEELFVGVKPKQSELNIEKREDTPLFGELNYHLEIKTHRPVVHKNTVFKILKDSIHNTDTYFTFKTVFPLWLINNGTIINNAKLETLFVNNGLIINNSRTICNGPIFRNNGTIKGHSRAKIIHNYKKSENIFSPESELGIKYGKIISNKLEINIDYTP